MISEYNKPEHDKNHNFEIPVSLSCKLDLSNYTLKTPQHFQTKTIAHKTFDISLYIHFEGINPYCILLKAETFVSFPILSIASYALKIYNSKFKTNFSPYEAHYFLVEDDTNFITEFGVKDNLPPYLEPITDLIIRIPERKKRALIFSNRFRKSKNKNQILNKIEDNNNSKSDLPNENSKETNDNFECQNSDNRNNQLEKIDDKYPIVFINNNGNDNDGNDSNNNDSNDNIPTGLQPKKKKEISLFEKNILSNPSKNDQSLSYLKNHIANHPNRVFIDACSLIKTHDVSEADLLIQKGDYFARIGDPKSASLFYWSAGIRGITSLVTLAKLSGELSIIERTRYQLLTHFPNEINTISTENQKQPSSIKEIIELLSDPKNLLLVNNFQSNNDVYFNSKLTATHPVNYMYHKSYKKSKNPFSKPYYNNYFLNKIQVRQFIKSISKTQPFIALKICLKYPEYTEFIPIPCRVEEVMEAFIQICVKQKYDSAILFYFAELFAKNGQISRAMQIGYNISVLSSLPECAMRRACWVMLVTRQFSNLFMLLETYFKRCQNRTIGFLSATIVYNHLMTVKKVNYKYKNTQRCAQTIVDPLEDPSDLDFLCIVLDAACFLFLSGYVDDFKDILSAISTQNRKYFEKTGIPPEFDFYVFIDKASTFAVNDRIAKESIFALGDEATLNNAYNTLVNFEMVIPHPIPRITIYDLRKGKKNLRKAAFWQQIRDCTMFHQILLVLGHYDILYTIPKLLQKDHTVMTFTDAVNKIIEIYLHTIEKIHRILPMKQIFIHPLKFHNKLLENQKTVFNDALKKVLPNYAVMLNENDCNVFYDNSLKRCQYS